LLNLLHNGDSLSSRIASKLKDFDSRIMKKELEKWRDLKNIQLFFKGIKKMHCFQGEQDNK
jgi:hypothetical protein